MSESPSHSFSESPVAPVRVLIVDDHPIVLEGLRFALETKGGFEIVGEAGTLANALELARRLEPQVVVLDLVLGGRDGMDGVGAMRRMLPEVALLVFSMNPEEFFAERALKAGANGYLMKTDGFEELRSALRRMLDGGTYVSARMVSRMLAAKSKNRSARDLDALSEREMQVFLRMGEGLTTGEIAAELNLSPKTVSNHRDHIKAKLGFTNGAELARRAFAYVLGQGRAASM